MRFYPDGKNAITERGRMLPVGSRRANADSLQPFYDSGTIRIHYTTSDVTRDGSGNVTAVRNRGSLGATHDATAVGAALPTSNATFSYQASPKSYLSSGGVIESTETRLMWIMDPADITHAMGFVGDPTALSRIIFTYTAPPARGLLIRATDNAGVVVNASLPATVWPTGLAVYELALTPWTAGGAGSATLFINGSQVSTVAHNFPTLPVKFFGQDHVATIGTQTFVGRMGEISMVRSGQVNTDAAVTAVRQRLTERAALG